MTLPLPGPPAKDQNIQDKFDTISLAWSTTQQEATTAVTAFSNGWVNFDVTTYTAAGYYRDPIGVVHLMGLIKSGTVGATVFTLPTGYRPLFLSVFAAISAGGAGRVDVFASGAVAVVAPSTNGFVSLEGITFRAMQ